MLVLLGLLLVGFLPTLSNDWGIDYWPGMLDGATGWGIPAHCFWGHLYGDGVNPDAVFGIVVLVVSYVWKMGGLLSSAKRAYRRWFRHPLDWLMESVLVWLARKYWNIRTQRPRVWLWSFRVVVAVYVPAISILECAASFSASLWISVLGLVFGTMQIQIPRRQNLDTTGSVEDNFNGFGQLVPLILLVQPAGAVVEHLWTREESPTTAAGLETSPSNVCSPGAASGAHDLALIHELLQARRSVTTHNATNTTSRPPIRLATLCRNGIL